MSFSIRLSPEEEKLAKSYAAFHGISLGEAFKRALFEKIEEEFDIALANQAHQEYVKDPKVYSFDEVKKALDL